MAGPTETQVIPSAALLEGLTALLAAGGPFDTPTLGLYQNSIAPSRLTVLADLTVANFSGYAAEAAETFSAAFYDVDGTALSIGGEVLFLATTATPFVSNTIYGYYLANAGLTLLKAVWALATPKNIAKAGDAIPVVPYLRWSGN